MSIAKCNNLVFDRKIFSLFTRGGTEGTESLNKAVGRKLLGGMPRQLWCFGDAGYALNDFSFCRDDLGEIWHLRCGLPASLWQKGHDWLLKAQEKNDESGSGYL